MKIVKLIQGSPEWFAHRAAHLNASDAPAMIGCSPYKTRAQLLREYATGVTKEVDAATQRRFDDGHRFEALARPRAEDIIGEVLYPCVGVEGRYSASFDGLTLLYDTAFEHKSLNDDLRAAFDAIEQSGGDGSMLPAHYQVQMEQQCMVSGAERVLFMASKWEGETLLEERHCWYSPNAELREQIVRGWAQLEQDVASYQPEQTVDGVLVGRSPDQLPALRIEVKGMVTASNLGEFKAHALAVLGSINRDLQTDEDFADAEQTVKWAKGVEDKLEAAKANALSQTADIEAVFRTIDDVAAETRRIRLELDKLVKARKDSLRAEIVSAGVASVRAHIAGVNASLGEHAMVAPASLQATIAEAIKGKKSFSSMREAVDAAAAKAKIEASQHADRVRANIAVLAEHADCAHLFPDRVQLCASKAPDDLRNLVAARVAEHQQHEAQRLEAERERIRQEEAARLAAEQRAKELVAAEAKQHDTTPAAEVPEPAPAPAPIAPVAPDRPVARIKLGDINARIAPLSITADGLAQLGFSPVGTERSAKLYAEADFVSMCRAMYRVIQSAAQPVEA